MAMSKINGKDCKEGSSTYKNMFGYKRWDGTTYDGACTFFGGAAPLPEGAGYGICLGIGTGFALLVAVLVWFANRQQAADHTDFTNSEVYTTAGRSIGVGLTAADVVSKWTWAATLLQSSNVAWQYGVSGPYWYASGATIQVLLFAILAIEIKRKCPAIHTMLEIVLARWGNVAHLTFLIFGFMTNIIVTAMLILGGAATMTALTGMSTYAACFCIPVPVSFYTAFGGLKGTYYASFTHTAVIYIALLIFIWKIYAGPSDLGSTNKMRANLICASHRQPAGDTDNTWNLDGQYIIMMLMNEHRWSA
jgi:Na+/proline symporter